MREEERFERLTTAELVQHAVEEARRAAVAEVLLARGEMLEAVKKARMSAVMLALSALCGVLGLALGFVLVALAFPINELGSLAIVGGFLLLVAGGAGLVGLMHLPRKPLEKTRERLSSYLDLAHELREVRAS